MVRIPHIPKYILLGLSAVVSSTCFGEKSSEIVITHEFRTAYYERAPSSMSNLIENSIISWCASADVKEKKESFTWLCQKKNLNFFRSVYINGNKGPHVLVCESFERSIFKYVGVDLVVENLKDGSCVSAEYDGKKYEFVLDNAAEEENT